MPSWYDLPAELKILIINYFVEAVFKIPAEECWAYPCSQTVRKLLNNGRRSRQDSHMPPLLHKDEPLFLRALGYDATIFDRLSKVETTMALHNEGPAELAWYPIRYAVKSLLVVAPEMKSEIISLLDQKQSEHTPYNSMEDDESERVARCVCTGPECKFLRRLKDWVSTEVSLVIFDLAFQC